MDPRGRSCPLAYRYRPEALAQPNGTLDPSFGNHGRVTTDFPGGADAAHALVIQADGKLVAAGSGFTGGGLRFDFALARYLN